MSHQVPWNKIIVEEFIKDAMLSKTEEEILRTRVAGWSITEQSIKLGLSISTVNRIISKLKIKYDKVEKTNPLLPPRRFSDKETWMDKN